MRIRNYLFFGAALAALAAAPVLADVTYTQGSGTTIFDFLCFSTKHCSAHTPINSAGTEIATSSNPFRTDPTGTTPQPVTQSGTFTVQPGNTANTTAWKVDGSAVTQPISASALPLPTGAASLAKQPAFGTAGSPSVDVISVQGVSSGTAMKVDGSAVTQPVSSVTLSTASAQASQLTQETATATGVGTPTDAVASSPASGSSATMIALLKAMLNTGQYPAGAVATNGSATGTTAATSTTLAATVSVTQYVCWISIRANATAAATANSTLSDGTKTFNFTQWTAPLASGIGVTEESFNPCIPASATNTAWTLTSAAPGSGGVVSVTIGGYKL